MTAQLDFDPPVPPPSETYASAHDARADMDLVSFARIWETISGVTNAVGNYCEDVGDQHGVDLANDAEKQIATLFRTLAALQRQVAAREIAEARKVA